MRTKHTEKGHKSERSALLATIFGLAMCVLGIVIIYLSYQKAFPSPEVAPSLERWAWTGDFFGGILNPVLTFATIFLLIYTTIMQRAELQNTREELAMTRQVLADTEHQSKKQADALEVQSVSAQLHLQVTKENADAAAKLEQFRMISRQLDELTTRIHKYINTPIPRLRAGFGYYPLSERATASDKKSYSDRIYSDKDPLSLAHLQSIFELFQEGVRNCQHMEQVAKRANIDTGITSTSYYSSALSMAFAFFMDGELFRNWSEVKQVVKGLDEVVKVQDIKLVLQRQMRICEHKQEK